MLLFYLKALMLVFSLYNLSLHLYILASWLHSKNELPQIHKPNKLSSRSKQPRQHYRQIPIIHFPLAVSQIDKLHICHIQLIFE